MHEARFGELRAQLTTLISRNCDTEKVLAEHHCLPGGHCACSTPNVPREWPCTVRQVAAQAHVLVAASRPAGMRAG